MSLDLDIAVVGGGVSGAYSAWRLQQAAGDQSAVALFEYSDRIGGRLFTKTMPGMPHVKAEVGGMRYIPDQHILVARLVEYLKLATQDFPMGAPPPVGANCNLFYLRGRHLRLHELADPDKVPYNLAWSERGLGADQPPGPGDERHLPEHGQPQPVRPHEDRGVRPAALGKPDSGI